MAHRLTAEILTSEAQLRALIGSPSAAVQRKVATRLTPLTRQWIDRAPFVCLATSGPDGSCDVSPRGDPPGFVRVLDDVTLLLPERPGNKLADSLRNLLANPQLGLLFIVPGVGETLRVNGRAMLTTDAGLLAPCTVEGRAPALGILVDVEQVYTQCPKAFLRSDFWNVDKHLRREDLPSNGAILQCLDPSYDGAAHDAERAARYARREGFY